MAGNFQAVITEGCLGMTEAVAGISHVFNITQVRMGTTLCILLITNHTKKNFNNGCSGHAF